MAEYLSPGVYTESVSKGGAVVEALSSSIGGFIGFAKRGTANKAVFINSWTAFLNEYAGGLETAFDKDNYLAYAVYGFFQNGGKKCYVSRITPDDSAIAEATTSKVSGISIKALNEGAWGNNIKVKLSKAADFGEGHFSVTVSCGSLTESYNNVTSEDIIDTISKESNLIVVSQTGEITLGEEEVTLANGADGTNVSALTTDMLQTAFDEVNDISMLCSPDLTAQADSNILLSYCTDKRIFAILQGEGSEDVSGIKTLRSKLNAGSGALYYPYGKVADPLSSIGALKKVPPCGHIMGLYAKTILNRGVWKNPAGVEYGIVGFVETEAISATQSGLKTGDIDVLNPLSINCIMARPNYGICVWGCRSLHSDTTLKYVADVMLKWNVMKSLEAGTQSFVFEPHDNVLWTKATKTVEAFLDTMWRDGAFLGDTSAQAYYVKCDESNNPEASRNLGRLIIECGYAQKKPAEFVVIKIAHQLQE